MADAPMHNYVDDAVRKGMKPEAVRKALHVAGWNDAQADRALAKAGKPPRPTPKAMSALRNGGVDTGHAPHRKPPSVWWVIVGLVLACALLVWVTRAVFA